MNKCTVVSLALLTLGSVAMADGVLGAPRMFDATDPNAMALAIEGKYLYGGAGDVFVVFDVSDPVNPRKVGETRGVGAARQLVVQKGFAYVTSREYGLWIVDATDPAHPRIRSRFDTVELATGVDVAGDVCFCGQRQNGVEFIDVSNPDKPRHIAIRKTDESQSVVYRDGWLYSGEWGQGHVTVFDAHDMRAIRQVALADLRGFGDGVWLQGDYLYAARGHHALHRPGMGPTRDQLKVKPGDPSFGGGHGLDIFDVRDPRTPKLLGSVDYPRLYVRGLDMWTPRTSGDLLFAAQTHNGLFVLDISDKTHPKVVDRWTSPCAKPNPRYKDDCVGSVAVGNGAVYAAVKGKGFFVFPCMRAKAEPMAKDVLPEHAEFRETYPTDEKAWHVWHPHDVGQVRGVALRGDVAYVACGDAGLYVLDVLPGNAGWRERCKVEGREQVYDVSVFGDRLYTAEGERGFGVYDISGTMPREIARLPQISRDQHLAFWVTAVGEDRVFFSDRRRWNLYDVSRLPKFKRLLPVRSSCPGWDKYLMDRPIDGRYMAFNSANNAILWLDVVEGKETARTTVNTVSLANGVAAFGNSHAILSRAGGFVMLAPNQVDPADGSSWPVQNLSLSRQRFYPGIPRADGSRVVFTSRIRRYVTSYDLADPARPVTQGVWQLAGNPELAAFHRGRMIIPCTYQGLLLQKNDVKANAK